MADIVTERLVPYDAVEYIADKQLKTSYNWAEIYAAEHNSAFTVAKIMDEHILQDIHRHLVKAIEGGQSFHSFKRDLLYKLGESGWGTFSQTDEKTGKTITRLSDRRLRKVYDVNTRQSAHAGTWERFQAGKKEFPYLQYRIGPSVEHRDEHLAWNGLVLPVDDPWWRIHMPMNGWGCKCWVRAITHEEATRIGISESPVIEYHDWLNKSTGEIIKVPKGIAPGFEHNVGLHRVQKNLSLITDTLGEVVTQQPRRATRLIQSVLAYRGGEIVNDAMKSWVTDIADTKITRGKVMAVGVIPEDVMKTLHAMDKAPHHSIIAVRDSDVLHALRDSKKTLGINLPIEFWQQLPQHLQSPSAILFQPRRAGSKKTAFDTLILVYEKHSGKLVIKIDYRVKMQTPYGKERVKLNMLTTASIVSDLSSLGVFEKLK